MIALLMDILTLSHHLLHWLPGAVLENKIFVGRLLLISSSALVIITLVTGFINSRNPQVRRIIIETPKLNNEKDYHLAIFADTHLGLIVGKEQLRQIALKVNNLKPDAILIVGDLVDEAPEGLLWAIDLLSSLQAPDGVWMVTGNHEFYYGIGSLTLITAPANIGLLRNEVQKLGESLALIGLEDATGGRQFGIEMPSISDLIKQTDTNLPTVLLHHSPLRIQEAAKAGVDIMVSGHTHAGQLWPVGYIADAVYGVKTGLSDIQGMKFYLTTGAGTWGPPARVGNRPEILELVIRGK
jgi:predicted MPP superfamily phosphohydrolase